MPNIRSLVDCQLSGNFEYKVIPKTDTTLFRVGPYYLGHHNSSAPNIARLNTADEPSSILPILIESQICLRCHAKNHGRLIQ